MRNVRSNGRDPEREASGRTRGEFRPESIDRQRAETMGETEPVPQIIKSSHRLISRLLGASHRLISRLLVFSSSHLEASHNVLSAVARQSPPRHRTGNDSKHEMFFFLLSSFTGPQILLRYDERTPNGRRSPKRKCHERPEKANVEQPYVLSQSVLHLRG